jgi:hypothetical protein
VKDDDEGHVVEHGTTKGGSRNDDREFSSNDIWMGVLSASSVKYFARIVPSADVGAVSLEEYEASRLI